MKKIFMLILFTFSLTFSSYAEKLQIFVSIVPQKYFVEKIGGEKTEVSVMVMPGSSPATYEPKPVQIQKLSKADIYFSVGVNFENYWLKRFKELAKNTKFIAADANIQKRHIEEHHHEEHQENDVHHEEENFDPHIWLSPKLVKIQCETIYNALVSASPESAEYFKNNYVNFMKEIDTIDSEIKVIISGVKNKKFIVFHPSWGYFADDYGLEMIAIEKEGKSPRADHLLKVIQTAKANGIKTVFVQPEFPDKYAKVIASDIGGKTAALSPLAYNWSENILKAAKAFMQN